MSLRKNAAPLIAAGAIMLGGISTANAVVIPGTSDPWLAGMPNGSTARNGDTAPAESPVLVPGLTLSAGEILTFSVTGSVSSTFGPPNESPDGSSFPTSHRGGPQNGITNLAAPFNSLVGVFLSDTQPSLSPTVPPGLNFTPPSGLGFASLSPVLQQPFFIGDGLTGTGTGSIQDFVVPDGATRLYLGTMDAYDWFSNSGSFDATVSIGGGTPTPTPTPTPTLTSTPTPTPGPTSVPEPATAPLLVGILAGFFLLRRRGSSA